MHHRPDVPARVGCVFHSVNTVDRKMARRWAGESRGDTEQCGFTRTVRSVDSNDLARVGLEVYTVKDRRCAVTLVNTFDAQNGLMRVIRCD